MIILFDLASTLNPFSSPNGRGEGVMAKPSGMR
jgi:hypothetical protein